MKYFFEPIDLAFFFIIDDFTVKKRFQTVSLFYKNFNEMLSMQYRKDEIYFRKAVNDTIINFELSSDAIAEINQIMNDVGMKCIEDYRYIKIDFIPMYFKIVKLKLMYGKNDYFKIKMRSLLKKFGYKRRSELLIDIINESFNKLGLKPYLKNYATCDISMINLDDMIIIREK